MGDAPELDQTVREIRRMVDTLPSWCPRIAWSLHPRDWELVAEQMQRQAGQFKSAEVLLATDKLYILGVRIFKDQDAPRLCDVGAVRGLPTRASSG